VSRFTVPVTGLILNGESKEQSSWNSQCASYGLKPEQWGKEVKINGKLFVLTNIKSKNSKYPIIGTNTGKSFKLSRDSVFSALNSCVDKRIETWDHLMREHQGNYNPHGIFKLGTCQISIEMRSGCGISWRAITNCDDQCNTCRLVKKSSNEPISHEEDCSGEDCGCDDPSIILEQLARLDFEFVGWNDKLVVDNPCCCFK
jgi:hypothetical protein